MLQPSGIQEESVPYQLSLFLPVLTSLMTCPLFAFEVVSEMCLFDDRMHNGWLCRYLIPQQSNHVDYSDEPFQSDRLLACSCDHH